MKLKTKFIFILLPLILIPIIITSLIFSYYAIDNLVTLHNNNMVSNMSSIISNLTQENSILDKLGVSDTQFYEINAQNHAKNIIEKMDLDNIKVDIYEKDDLKMMRQDSIFSEDIINSMLLDIAASPDDIELMYRDVKVINNKKYIMYYQYFKPWNWLVILYVDQREIYSSIISSYKTTFLTALFFIALIGYILLLSVNKLLNPISDLLKASEEIASGHYDYKLNTVGNDELSELSKSFNHMSEKLNKNFKEIMDITDELYLANDKLNRKEKELIDLNSNLEDLVQRRTLELQDINSELEQSIEQLNLAQDELVESRKLMALNSLVTGLSHELNTPLGIAITSISYITLEITTIMESISSGKVSKSNLLNHLQNLKDSSEMIFNNLNKTSEIIDTFKLLSVRDNREAIKDFDLSKFISNIVVNSGAIIKTEGHSIEFNYDKSLFVSSYPGVITQIINQLINNSVQHGFKDIENGLIKVSLTQKGNMVFLTYKDNGVGMSPDVKNRVFEPFYTTNFGKGSKGLGLNIVYNLVTGILAGKLNLITDIGMGVEFIISFPINLKDVK